MADLLRAVARRHAELTALLSKGGGGSRAARAARNFAYPLGKDAGLLGYSDPGASVVATDDGQMRARFVVSTSSPDRDGDVVRPEGFRLDNYRKNPVWSFGHFEWKVPVGRGSDPKTGQLCVFPQPEKGRVVADCYFDAGDPDAVYLYGKVVRGMLNATSIGFLPQDGFPRPVKKGEPGPRGMEFTSIDLLEISIVAVPANAEAVRLSLEKDKLSDRLRKALSPYAAPRAAWSPGWSPDPMSKKWKKAPAPKADPAPLLLKAADAAGAALEAVQKAAPPPPPPPAAGADAPPEGGAPGPGANGSATQDVQLITTLTEALSGFLATMAQLRAEAEAAAAPPPGTGGTPGDDPFGGPGEEDEDDPFGEADEDAEAGDDGELTDAEDEEETEEALQRYRRSAPRALTKGPPGGGMDPVLDTMAGAADHLDTLGDHDALDETHKAACKYHAMGLRKACKDVAESDGAAGGDVTPEGGPEEKGLDEAAVLSALDALAARTAAAERRAGTA